MIKNYIIFRDFETAELDPHGCQISEIAAVAIDPRSLTIVENSLFHTKVCPEWNDEKAIKDGFLPVNFVSLGVSKFTKESLEGAPPIRVAWQEYVNYLSKFNLKGKGGSNLNAPIVAGYNSSNFDDIIDRRLCDKLGPQLNARKEWSIYHPGLRFDLLHFLHILWNNISINDKNSMSFDSVREYAGMDKDNAHTANVDVLQGAFFLIKILKMLRALNTGELTGSKIKYQNCFEQENAAIKDMLCLK